MIVGSYAFKQYRKGYGAVAHGFLVGHIVGNLDIPRLGVREQLGTLPLTAGSAQVQGQLRRL
ncbi:hypothetical protein D3C71_2052920 [compost metagenome]